MSWKNIEENLKKLYKIRKIKDTEERKRKLKEMGEETAAPELKRNLKGGEPTRSELEENIHIALQTQTMIEMCKISSRNYIIALVASGAALLSAFAAWVAVLVDK